MRLSALHLLCCWCSSASRQPAALSKLEGLRSASDESLQRINPRWAAACLRMCRFAVAASETAGADAQVTGQLLTRVVRASELLN